MSQLEPSVRVVSPGAGQLELTADQASVTLVPGTQRPINMVLRNAGGTSLTVDLGVSGPPSQWISLSDSFVTLAPAQSARVTLTLMPPAGAPTGSYPLEITAQARNDPSIRLEFDPILEIAEPGQVTVALSPAQADGQSSAEFQVRVSQSGTTPLHVNLSATGDQGGCNFTFSPATLQVGPNETATSKLTVSARQGLSGVDTRTYPFAVMATTTEGATAMSRAQGQFVQHRLPPLEFTVKPARQSGPGPVTFAVRIGNPSQVAASFRLAAEDAGSACQCHFEPPSLTVPAGSASQATLTVTPFQFHSDSVDKTHNLTIRAVPADGFLSPMQASAVFTQTAIELPIVSLSPSSQSASKATSYNVQLSNPRATPVSVEISPSSNDGMCELDISPARITVPPHGRAVARLNVRPIGKLLPGESRRTCAFTVQARTADLTDPVKVDGSLVQVPGAPVARWLGMAAGALLALAVCGGLLWWGSSALRSLGSSLPEVGALIPTPLPLVTPIPIPTDTATPIPTIAPAPTVAPQGGQKSSSGGGGGNSSSSSSKPTVTPTKPNVGATQTAQAKATQAAATATAAAEQTLQARYAQYNGLWANDDANTNGITRLQISNSDSTITVHGFGKCSPTDCDWGSRNGTFKNEPFVILFDFGGGLTEQLTLFKENGKLRVVDVGSRSGTNTYMFHSQLFLPPIQITLVPPFRATLVRPSP